MRGTSWVIFRVDPAVQQRAVEGPTAQPLTSSGQQGLVGLLMAGAVPKTWQLAPGRGLTQASQTTPPKPGRPREGRFGTPAIKRRRIDGCAAAGGSPNPSSAMNQLLQPTLKESGGSAFAPASGTGPQLFRPDLPHSATHGWLEERGAFSTFRHRYSRQFIRTNGRRAMKRPAILFFTGRTAGSIFWRFLRQARGMVHVSWYTGSSWW